MVSSHPKPARPGYQHRYESHSTKLVRAVLPKGGNARLDATDGLIDTGNLW